MALLFVTFLVWLLVTPALSALVYAGYNLALVPWLGWPEMPATTAVFLGATVALILVVSRLSVTRCYP